MRAWRCAARRATAARLAIADRLGFATSIAGADALEEEGYDVAVDCSGAGPGIADAMRAARRHGTLVQIGLAGKDVTLPYDLLCFKELSVATSLATTPASWRRSTRLIADRSVALEPLVSDVVAAGRLPPRLRRLARRRRREVRPGPAVTGAVLFDLDGTLADTEPLSQAAWTAVIGGHGYEPTPEDLAGLTGKSFGQAYAVFAAHVALPGEEAIFAEHSAHLFPAIDAELEVFADAIGVVRALAARGVPLALVSASRRPRVKRTLRAAGIDGCFDVLVCGGEVSRPKPAPDGYLAAAAALGVAPARCVVIEDTASGVQAGRAAGARVIVLERIGAVAADAHARAGELTLQLVLDELERAC